jgi:hypothetical protein
MVHDVFTLKFGKSMNFGSRFQRKRTGEQYQDGDKKKHRGDDQFKLFIQ